MSKIISLALVLLAAGALAVWASGGTDRHGAGPAAGLSIATIADTSTSWAEFSARVPNLQEALTRDAQQASLAAGTRR